MASEHNDAAWSEASLEEENQTAERDDDRVGDRAAVVQSAGFGMDGEGSVPAQTSTSDEQPAIDQGSGAGADFEGIGEEAPMMAPSAEQRDIIREAITNFRSMMQAFEQLQQLRGFEVQQLDFNGNSYSPPLDLAPPGPVPRFARRRAILRRAVDAHAQQPAPPSLITRPPIRGEIAQGNTAVWLRHYNAHRPTRAATAPPLPLADPEACMVEPGAATAPASSSTDPP